MQFCCELKVLYYEIRLLCIRRAIAHLYQSMLRYFYLCLLQRWNSFFMLSPLSHHPGCGRSWRKSAGIAAVLACGFRRFVLGGLLLNFHRFRIFDVIAFHPAFLRQNHLVDWLPRLSVILQLCKHLFVDFHQSSLRTHACNTGGVDLIFPQ